MCSTEVVVVDDLRRRAARNRRPGRETAGRPRALSSSKSLLNCEPHAGEGDLRADLRGEAKSSQRNRSCRSSRASGPRLGPLGREVGDGVQADVVVAAAEAVERIQPADRVVAFEDADALIVVREANAGGEARHAGADDDRVVHGREVAGAQGGGVK